MRDYLDDLRATAQAMASAHQATDSEPTPLLDQGLWDELEKAGFLGLGSAESLGGSGGDVVDSTVVLGELRTARVPYAESTVVAAPALSAAGLQLPAGPFTSAELQSESTSATLSGRAVRVPYARDCADVVLLDNSGQPMVHVVRLEHDEVEIEEGYNLAGEARDTLTFRGVTPLASAPISEAEREQWQLRAALARAVASAGVASDIADLTVRYVNERVQFGRPLMRFQAVQHTAARLAAEATAMQVAAESAALALADGSPSAAILVAAAKAETAALSRSVAALAHQAHGAIGFTREYVLGALTTRLWSWREEHGNERVWQARLGALARGTDLWELITGATADADPTAILDKILDKEMTNAE